MGWHFMHKASENNFHKYPLRITFVDLEGTDLWRYPSGCPVRHRGSLEFSPNNACPSGLPGVYNFRKNSKCFFRCGNLRVSGEMQRLWDLTVVSFDCGDVSRHQPQLPSLGFCRSFFSRDFWNTILFSCRTLTLTPSVAQTILTPKKEGASHKETLFPNGIGKGLFQPHEFFAQFEEVESCQFSLLLNSLTKAGINPNVYRGWTLRFIHFTSFTVAKKTQLQKFWR